MIFLGTPRGWSEHYIMMTYAVIFVIIILIATGLYYKKNRKIAKGKAASRVFIGLLSIFIISLPVGTIIGMSIWDLRIIITVTIVEIIIIIIAFYIFIFLIESKRRILKKAGVEPEIPEPIRVTRETGLKVGSAILVIGSLFIVVTRIFNIDFFYGYYFDATITNILAFVLSGFILATSIYNHYRKRFAIFGYVFCLMGSILMISLALYLVFTYPNLLYLNYSNIISILVGSIAIIGLVINQRGYKIGSQICMGIGAIDVILIPLSFVIGIGYTGFMEIFWFIPFEPLLIIIGGAFLYQEHLKT